MRDILGQERSILLGNSVSCRHYVINLPTATGLNQRIKVIQGFDLYKQVTLVSQNILINQTTENGFLMLLSNSFIAKKFCPETF